MILAVMQPYLFPYIGYYQLAAAVDEFVMLDDVTYIKQGWINRNQLLIGGKPAWFTIPLSGAGSHVLIRDVRIDARRYPQWRTKFLKSLAYNYQHAPYYNQTIALVEQILPSSVDQQPSLATIAGQSITAVMEHVGMPPKTSASSEIANPDFLRGPAKVVHLCRQFGANTYLNLPGGVPLYDRKMFEESGIALKFIKPGKQLLATSSSIDGTPLSILHTLLRHEVSTVRTMLHDYCLE